MDGFTASLLMYNSDVRKQTQREALAFVMPPFKKRDCLAARSAVSIFYSVRSTWMVSKTSIWSPARTSL